MPLALLLGALASAQTTHDLATWTSVGLLANLHGDRPSGPRLWTDLHARRTDASFTGIVRPGLGWDLADWITVYAGYAWIPQVGESTADELLSEHRAWEQLLLQRRVGELTLGLRPRLEQRFLEAQPEVGHRLRLWGRAAVPVGGDLSLVLTDEVFLGLGATAWSPSGFDQNRLFVGPALPVSEVGRVELGYTNTFLARETGDTVLHVVSANLYLNLP